MKIYTQQIAQVKHTTKLKYSPATAKRTPRGRKLYVATPAQTAIFQMKEQGPTYRLQTLIGSAELSGIESYSHQAQST